MILHRDDVSNCAHTLIQLSVGVCVQKMDNVPKVPHMSHPPPHIWKRLAYWAFNHFKCSIEIQIQYNDNDTYDIKFMLQPYFSWNGAIK